MYKRFSSFLNQNQEIVIILCLALLARLAYFFIILHNFGSAGFYLNSNGDAVEYFTLAKQWLSYETFQNFRGINQPEVFRMPGYPLFIAFFYKFIPDVLLPILAQNLIFVCFIGYFYKFSIAVFKNKKISLIGAGLLAFEPSVIYWNSQLITETIFAVLIFGSVYASFLFGENRKLYWSALAGLFLALADFVRPAGEYLVIVFFVFFIACWLWHKISAKKLILGILIFSLGFALPLAPWILRNKAAFGSYAISNSSEIAFGKYATAIGNALGNPVDITFSDNPFINASSVRKEAAELIFAHPMVFARLYALSLAPFLFGDAYLSVFGRIFSDLENSRVITDWEGGTSQLFGFIFGHQGAEAVVFFGGKIIWFVIILLALRGSFIWIKSGKNIPLLLLLIFLMVYFSLASGIGSYSRFRFPVEPYIFFLCAIDLTSIRIKFFNKRLRLVV